INNFSFRKHAEGANVIDYPDEMGFLPAIVMVDMQLEHATKASLPSPRFPGEQGWYFNQGEKAGITDDWFTVAALVGAGPSPGALSMSRRRLAGTFALCVILIGDLSPAGAATASSPGARCAAAKLKAAAKKEAAKLACQRRALLKSRPVDPACLAKA